MVLVSAWVHDEPHVPISYLGDNVDPQSADLVVDLSLIAAALLRCWANEVGVPPTELLAALAIGQALDETSV